MPDVTGSDGSSGAVDAVVQTRGVCRKLQWGPGGQQLAFELHDPQTSRSSLLLYHRGARRLHAISHPVAYEQLYQLRFAPAQSHAALLYVGRTAKGREDLMLQPGGLLQFNSRQDDLSPAWSATGEYVAFTSHRTGKGDLYWFSMKARKLQRLTHFSSALETHAAWSPTSPRSLLYLRKDPRGDAFFLVKDVLRPGHIRLYPRTGYVRLGRPTWSPKGGSFAFFVEQQGRKQLQVMDVMSLKVRTVAKDLQILGSDGPRWSPDGRHLVVLVSSTKGSPLLIAIDASTGRQQILSTAPHHPDTFAIYGVQGGPWQLAYGVSPSRGGRCALYLKQIPALP